MSLFKPGGHRTTGKMSLSDLASSSFSRVCCCLLLLLTAADAQPTESPELLVTHLCPELAHHLREGGALSLRLPGPGNATVTRCTCDQAGNARRVCPVRQCEVSDPSLLQPDYRTNQCVSDKPNSIKISLMDFYCRETDVQLRVLEFAGSCAGFSVYRPAIRTVKACGLEAFRTENYFYDKKILHELAEECDRKIIH
ncbi:hypothetical protein BOX15_Mlig027775g1 [Macrostomum lignano]|uniref:Uncharacterized protein n=1 Tax=Macrostomum lignano TaxID=282301 RepID=A0A267F1W1_9PLAT|nr:hypothetical protein BOX15_Mlig027775g1 [Macrostomum lignano]